MGTVRLIHAKLHRVRVTSTNVDYVGSLTIDPELLDKVGLLPLEEVDVVNLNNGKRWSTYVIPGTAGSREICPNGGAALLCDPGDLLIVYAYETCDRINLKSHLAKVLVADAQNNVAELMSQILVQDMGAWKFTVETHNQESP
ncbi:MAG: aspartate 1-decarboxylase [Cyanobacteria bacterium P01_H01_bin.15]